jgi:hypothetical protein
MLHRKLNEKVRVACFDLKVNTLEEERDQILTC